LVGVLRKELGPVLQELAQNKESEVLEGQMLLDHAHVLISISPEYSAAHVVGYIKGKKIAIHGAQYPGRKKNFTAQHFLARGYFVSTVGLDEIIIRQYIQRQEADDRRLDQLQLFE